jgi:hypothetical protein
VLHFVAAIIEDDVGSAKLRKHAIEKPGVALITDAYRNLILLEPLACFENVETNDLTERPKVALPHLKRSTLSAPDLKKQDWAIHVASEMILIDGKVVGPFMDQAALVC